jgi:hypothetical protein
MKTLLMALAAASFISTSASARIQLVTEIQVYNVVLPYEPDTQYQVSFKPSYDGDNEGITSMEWNGGGEYTDMGHWSVSGDGIIDITIAYAGHERWTSECEEWPTIELHETVSDPCWMTSTEDRPIQVTRAH